MKNYHLAVLILLLLGCSSNNTEPDSENNKLLGKWKLIEQLSDPGDGSGTFIPVESDKTITFFSNGSFTASGSLCLMTTSVGENTQGVFEKTSNDLVDANYDGVLIPDNCEFSDFNIYFNQALSGHLIIWFPCIEACAEKFEKI